MAFTETTYLIHFEAKYEHVQHYIGSAVDVEAREQEHRSNRGARLLEVINQVGIAWSVVRTWKGGRRFERQLKNRKNASVICPVCSGKAAYKRAAETGRMK